jgi:hypothetical protein
VDQVQADEQLRLAVRKRADGVEVPHFLEQSRGHEGNGTTPAVRGFGGSGVRAPG